jgi:hypothetical protein
MAPQITVGQLSQKDSPADQMELIATPFGKLTGSELRDWERMLGRKLLRLPKST